MRPDTQESELYFLQRYPDNGFNVAADIEIAFDNESAGLEILLQRVEDQIRDRFVRYSLIAKTVQIELQALEFDDFFVRGIGNPDRREIRIP